MILSVPTDFENPTAAALLRPQLSLELSCPSSLQPQEGFPSPLLITFTAGGKHSNAAVRDKPSSAQTEPVQECWACRQPMFQPRWWKQGEKGSSVELFLVPWVAWHNLCTRTPPQVDMEEDDTNIKGKQTDVTACVGKGQHSLNCDLLLAENRVCLAQHSLKNCAALVHSEKPLGLKKVKWVMGENYFWPMNISH